MSSATPALPFDRPNPLEPPPAYAELRDRAPVARVVTPEGQPAWLVTSYDAAATVLADPRFAVTPPGGGYPGNDSLFQDGPAHARLRRLVGRAFTPRHLAGLRPRVEEAAAGHVAAMVAAGPPADLVAALAAPLSIAVVGELLGVRIDEHARLRRLADAALTGKAPDPDGVRAVQPDGRPGVVLVEQAWAELAAYAAELVAAKRDRLADDLLSALITVRDAEDGRLGDGELVTMVTTLVASGYLSSCNAICTGVAQLAVAGRLSDLTGDDERVESAVEEVLRHQSGLTGEALPRWARQDLDLAGVRVAAGEMLLVRLAAANRDPARFPYPDRFDPDRKPNPHLAFGRGPHHCLAAPLARIEVAAALRALALGLPGLRLAGPVEEIPWVDGAVDSGPTALHVTW
ncbi:cytochrome P450 [Micromonospora sp. NPDC049559]|uniref:cytochrome P450 n=1 Tax=Micromonospora sp. NPDC049559 TaxID=3155923 RepID=UPI003436BFAE